jgi:hypothetical protein
MKRLFSRKFAAAAAVCSLLVASGLLLVADVEDQYSEWGEQVNLGEVVNTAVFAEIAPCVSRDGLSLYFFSDRPGGYGDNDLYVSQRASVDDAWGPPQNLGSIINSEYNDSGAWLTIDGHQLYFTSNRPGGFGGLDLYVSRRHNKRDDFAWQTPVNLGSGVNTSADELGTSYFEDDKTGTITLYFGSNRPGGMGGDDLYASTLQPDETFGPAMLVEELSSPYLDRLPGIRRDGLEMIITSGRPGGFGFFDLWVSTRRSTSDPWSTPVNLGPDINTSEIDGGASFSFDGTTLFFHSTRDLGFPDFDLFVATRSKLTGRERQKE